jgi:putative endopeptidase
VKKTVRFCPAKYSLLSLLCLSLLVFARPGRAQGQGMVVPVDIERSIRPGDDFYRYANGGWINRVEIPPDRAGLSTFSLLTDISNQRTAELLKQAPDLNAPAGAGPRKIRDLYQSYMDEAGIEARGLGPIKPHLDEIAAISNKQELARALGQSLRADVDALNNTNFHTPNLFGLWVAPDFNDPEHYAAYLLQGGLELPDREYYLSGSEHMRSLLLKYRAHVAAILRLAGVDDSEARAGRVLELEHRIAELHSTLADNQDIHKANNHWGQADFGQKAPGVDWSEYFRGAGLAGQQEFIVWQPSAFQGEAALVASEPLALWKDWLAYHLIEAYADVLPKALAEERFAFFGKILSGTPENRSRAERAVELVNAELGDEVGRLYVERYFPPQAKAHALEMVARIIAAFRKRIAALAWMDAKTKAEAQAKLNSLYVGIGYPETWHDYSGYEIDDEDLFGNLWRGRLFAYRRQVARLGKAVDRHEWTMTPQTVNAVNLPLQNAINFPAAILEPPFFNAQAPDAQNYGAIGSVIGHEVSHTFDSQGSAFDGRGAVRNWWTAADLEHFNAATAKLAAQFDSYRPFPDLAVNGKLTLGENIADVAGLAAAYDAYRATLGGKPAPVVDGFSGDQQFFLAYVQSKKSKIREAALRRQVLTNEHAPSEYRADTVRNLDPWYEAFSVMKGERLYLSPEDRVRIW